MIHTRMAAAALLLTCVSLPGAARAGDPPSAVRAQAPTEGSRVDWLTAYRFHLTAASIRTDDPRFNWDAHFGGDLDLVDYGFGRINMVADYGVTIGSEVRTIDPNQGAYHLNVSASLRPGAVRSAPGAPPAGWVSEVQGVFDHVSRHLSDRANLTSVSWNSAGVVATARRESGPVRATLTARAAKVVQAAFVDYAWLLGAGAESEYRLSRRAALVARGDVAPVLVSEQVAGRGAQVAATLEGAVRLYGTGAGVELFAAWERRVDPYPLERATGSWALLGFRLISR